MILYKICKNIPILSLTTYNQNDTIKEDKKIQYSLKVQRKRGIDYEYTCNWEWV